MFENTLPFIRRGLRPLFAAAVLLGASTSAYAGEDAGVDEVTLKNGGSIRGTVVTVAPGDKVVVLEIGAKEPRTIAWSEVADVEKGKYGKKEGSDVEPGSAGPGYGDPSPAEPREGEEKPAKLKTVKVHIESEEPVSLHERGPARFVFTGRGAMVLPAGQAVCTSPCGEEVDVSQRPNFYIAGEEIPDSRNFRLDRYSSDVTIAVAAGDSGLRAGGGWLIGIGAPAIAAGILTIALAAGVEVLMEDETPSFIAGGVATGAGTALLGAGIAMIVAGKTTVEVREGAPGDQAFHLDSRPRAIEPIYWLGQF